MFPIGCYRRFRHEYRPSSAAICRSNMRSSHSGKSRSLCVPPGLIAALRSVRKLIQFVAILPRRSNAISGSFNNPDEELRIRLQSVAKKSPVGRGKVWPYPSLINAWQGMQTRIGIEAGHLLRLDTDLLPELRRKQKSCLCRLRTSDKNAA
jgi:hypothetical protein